GQAEIEAVKVIGGVELVCHREDRSGRNTATARRCARAVDREAVAQAQKSIAHESADATNAQVLQNSARYPAPVPSSRDVSPLATEPLDRPGNAISCTFCRPVVVSMKGCARIGFPSELAAKPIELRSNMKKLASIAVVRRGSSQ